LSSRSAALAVSFPDSTSLSNSASVRSRTSYEERDAVREKTGNDWQRWIDRSAGDANAMRLRRQILTSRFAIAAGLIA
jgi:trans-2-enoyl-CoA reductase